MAIFSGIVAAIGSAFTAVSGFIGGLGAFGTFALKTVASFGVSLFAQRLGGNDDPVQASFGVSGQIQAAGDVARSFMLGLGATAGSMVYHNTWGVDNGTPNAFYTRVVALSDWPVAGLAEVWVNGEKATLDTANPHPQYGFPVTQYRTGGQDYCWVKFYDGTQTVADSFLTTRVSSEARYYETTRVGTGVAYAICTSRTHPTLWTGWPTFLFVLNGIKLYDVTKDSTQGGDGPQRWGDPSTWGGDGDHLPAVQAYNLLKGLRYGSDWFYGLQGLTQPRLPSAHWRAQIEKCRALIAGPNGMEPTFRSGAEIEVSAPLADAIEGLNTASSGRLAEIGGIYKMHGGAPDAPVFSFDDGFILSSEEQSFTPFFGLADTINGVTATYPSPAEGWKAKAAPPLYNPDYEAEDGNRRLPTAVPLDFVSYDGQVQRLMQSALAEARRARRHTFSLPSDAWILEPGDTIEWSSSRNGYIEKLFRVDGAVDRANLDVLIDITEVDPTDHDWNQEGDYTPPTGSVSGPVRPPVQTIAGFAVEAVAVFDNAGNPRRPGIKLLWPSTVDGVEAVAYEVRLQTTAAVIHRGRADQVGIGETIITSQAFLPATQYQVRAIYVPRGSRSVEWSDWLPVTTLNLGVGPLDVLDNAITADKIANAAVTADKLMNEAVTSLKLAAEAVTSAKIQTGAVLEAKLAANAVTVGKIANGAVETAKLADAAITEAKLGALAVTAAKLASSAVTETKIADNAISTPKLQANSVVAGKIAADTITARELIIADFTNLVPDNQIQDASVWSITGGGVFTHDDVYVNAGSKSKGRFVYNSALATGTSVIRSKLFPVTAGDTLYLEIQAARLNGGTRTGQAAYGFYDENLTSMGGGFFGAGFTAETAGFQNQIGEVLVPAGAKFANIGVNIYNNGTPADMVICGPFARIQAGANLIVDGAVIASKLAAGSVIAGKIAAGAITADDLAVGAIVADKIAANAVVAASIAASAVTGDKIAANSVTSDKLVANSITARELILTDFANLVPDPHYQVQSLWTAFLGTVWTPGTPVVEGWGVKSKGCYYNNGDQATGGFAEVLRSTQFAVEDRQAYNITWEMRRYNAGQARCRLVARNYDRTGAQISFIAISGGQINTESTVPVQQSITYTPPVGTVLMQIGVQWDGLLSTSGFIIGYISVRPMRGAELIVDGGITADKVAANAITASKINVSSLSAISATLGSVDISQANIGTLTVGTSNIQQGAVTEVYTAGPYSGSGTSMDLSLTVNHGPNSGELVITMSGVGRTSDGNGNMRFQGFRAGGTGFSFVIPGIVVGNSDVVYPVSQTFRYVPPAGNTSTVLLFSINRSSGSLIMSADSMIIVCQQLKR